MKLNQIIEWRQERILDGEQLMTDLMSENINSLIMSNSSNDRRLINNWLHNMKSNPTYADVSIVDAKGNSILSTNKNDRLGEHGIQLLSQALSERKTLLSDIHTAPLINKESHLDLVIPFIPKNDHKRPATWALFIRIDPDIYLYPLLREWPLSSDTAETLIVRKDGDDVLYLSDLKFHGGSALKLRISLKDEAYANVPAVMGAKGKRGFVEGVDYRNEPVIAVIKDIPGTPWIFISKIDKQEAYKNISLHTFSIFLIVLLCIAVASSVTGMLWYQRKKEYVQIQYDQEMKHSEAQQEIQSELKRRTNMLNAIFDNVPNILMLVNRSGEVEKINHAGENFAGRNKEQLVSLLQGEIFGCANSVDKGCGKTEACADCPVRSRVLRSFNTCQESRNEEGRLKLLRDGEPIFIDFLISTVPLILDSKDYVLVSITDITDQKLVQNALKESRENLELALKSARMGTFVFDVVNNIRYFDNQTCRIFGIDPSSFRVSTDEFFSLIHPDDRDNIVKSLSQTLEFDALYEPRYRRLFSDGSVRFLTARGQVIRDVEGRPVRLNGLVWDETERVEVENALRESQANAELILNSAAEGIYGINSRGMCIFFNKSALKMLGYESPNELIGKKLHPLIHHTRADGSYYPAEECIARNVLTKGDSVHSDMEILWRSDGTSFPAEFWAYPVFKDNKIDGSVVTFIDITERKSLEAQLVHAQKMESVGTLAGGIAHDFNNILSAIIGFSHVALMTLENDSSIRPIMEQIIDASNRAAGLTKQLLAFSRKQKIHKTEFDLNELAGFSENMLRRLIRQDIAMNMHLYDGELIVSADRNQIEQIFINLVTNARDAMPNGGSITFETDRTSIDYEFIALHNYGKLGEYALITVKDTGIGMNEEIRERIFEPFFTTKEVGKGTGLGMSVIYGVIKEHEGFINVESSPGKGTTFRIYMPLSQKMGLIKKPVYDESSPTTGSETILVAEDDDNMRKTIKEVLEQYGYTVITAVNGEDALLKFRENIYRIQLLIFDMIMPVMNGKKAYEEICLTDPDMPVLFITGYAAGISSEIGSIDDDSQILYKPISPKELIGKIRSLLDRNDRGK